MINWKVRLKNKVWVIGVISELFLFFQLILLAANTVGITDFALTDEVKTWLIGVVNAIFGLIAAVTRVVDPTTNGFKDSKEALNYQSPKVDIEER